ncbi:isoamylase early set domain-containing protein [Chloroflexus sp. MS-G]|jgi:1,4-alpha-glucan branching enzyme|uniref:isoamylase early set domain-containing protein n=1 Tax=Chloroflexus sp. MS-G TaxID=1521187 RepID=UPI0004DED978|nr:isoamylase early set domain-containing protein [Chloroflexus sp. MS-G]MBO9348557.1 isoamylase early set domain-containing protein [Chloroflexus sp.]
MITKQIGPAGKVRVTFSLPAAIWADTIHLVGDFNGWNPRATPLRATEHGWMVTLDLDAGRIYQYRYLVNDNEWHNDWNADGYVPNPYGGDNSVVDTTIFADSEPEAEQAVGQKPALMSFPPRLRLVSNG